MSVVALRCPSCLAPVDPERGSTQHCAYCGGSLIVDGAVVGQPGELRAMTSPFRSAPAGISKGPGVFMEDCGHNKIMVIKAIRECTGLGLKEAKDLAESAPCVIGEGLDTARLAKLREDLVAAGARVR